VDRQEPVDALDFHDEGVIDDQVEPIAAVERRALLLERQGPLALELEPEEREFVSYAMLVGRLEQPRPQVSVHLDAGTDHGR
jgi:hypothetical protein